jgi:SAM-dependent methyltransferase
MESISCNLCGSDERDTLYSLPDYLLEKQNNLTVLVKCNQCGLIYQNPRPTINEIGVHYPQEYDSYHPVPNSVKDSRLMSKAIQYGINKRCRIVNENCEGGSILDIGCATGEFLNGMRQYPTWNIYGVEISPFASQIARERFNLEIFTGTLEQATYPDEFFDAVTLWDVFEHLHDPARTLMEIHRILKPKGILVVRVPNIISWDARIFGQYWAGLDAPRHLFVFNPSTLSTLLQKGGFEVKKIGCPIGSYPTFVLSLRFWMVGKGIRYSIRDRILQILNSPIARLCTAPIFFLMNRGLRGPLITTIAIK